MKHEVTTIDNLLGFGNDRLGSDGEHYASANFKVGRSGMAMSEKLTDVPFNTTYFDNTEITPGKIDIICSGPGMIFETLERVPFVYAIDRDYMVWASANGTANWRLLGNLLELDSALDNGFAKKPRGMNIGPKGRLIVSTRSDISIYDPDLVKFLGGIDVTNGSNKIDGTGFNDVSGTYWVDEYVIINDGDTDYIYKVTAQTDTELTLSANYDGTTQTGIDAITRAGWTTQAKTIATVSPIMDVNPHANYEDTVLIGRNNQLSTFNVVSDSVAANAIDFPNGFNIRNLLVGSTGILIVANFNERGYVALWDNDATRSIAPWIPFQSKITGATVLDSQFIIRTLGSFYITDGYSERLLKTDFLDQDTFPERTENRDNMANTNDGFYMGLDSEGYHGKAKSGIYHYHSSTELFTHLRASAASLKDLELISTHSDPSSGRVFFSTETDGTTSFKYLEKNKASDYASYISEELVPGPNKKYASSVYLDISVADPAYQDNPISFTVVCKVASVDQQMQTESAIKTTMTENDEIVVDETVYAEATLGDEVVILEGNNAGQTRNIESIADGGTDTATYTLDRDLDNLSDADTEITLTPFRLVGVQTYTDEDRVPDVFFDVKNDVKGRRFMLKVEIIDADIPLELRPSYFVYENDTIV